MIYDIVSNNHIRIGNNLLIIVNLDSTTIGSTCGVLGSTRGILGSTLGLATSDVSFWIPMTICQFVIDSSLLSNGPSWIQK